MRALLAMIFYVSPLVFFVLAGMAHGGVWDSTYEGAAGTHAPITNSTARSAIDDHIRNDRQNVRYRGEVEHLWDTGPGPSDDNGLHRLGSARCYMSATAPVILSDSHSGTTGLTDYLNTSTSGGGVAGLEDSASTSAGAAEDDVGHGRCWIDTDDNNRLYFYHGVAGDNTPAAPGDGWKPAGGSSRNLIFHGSFEGTDGDGDSTSTTIPYGWTASSAATFSYASAPVTEGAGLAVVTTNTSTDDGIVQTLAGLRSSSGYRATVRVLPTTDVCQLVIGGAARTAPTGNEVETSTTGSYVSLGIDFFTDATPADITLTLQGEGATAVCTWDNVVVESFTGPETPNVLFYEATSTATTACDDFYTGTCADIVTIKVTPPGPGYFIVIFGTVRFTVDADASCHVEIENVTTTTSLVERSFNQSTNDDLNMDIQVQYMGLAVSAAGSEVVYTLNARESANECALSEVSKIQAMLISSGR
jgi:hypothetical protein